MSKSNLPLVTVIIPCYNHEKYIEKCIKSIYNQTYANYEVIVVDDYSTDNSIEVIKHLQKKYDFRYIEHKENWGLIKTLNDVIFNYANGQYIKCIASDDYLTEDCLDELVCLISQNSEYAFVYGQAQAFNTSIGDNEVYGKKTGREITTFEELFYTNSVPGPSALFIRQKFLDIGGIPEQIYIEDYYLWLKFAQKNSFAFVNKVIAYYREDRNSSTRMSNNYNVLYTAQTHIRCIFASEMSYNEKIVNIFFKATIESYINYQISLLESLLKVNKIKAFLIYLKNFHFFLKGRRKICFSFWVKLFK